MSRSPAVILYDSNGNAVSVVQDGSNYRLLSDGKARLYDSAGNAITTSENHVGTYPKGAGVGAWSPDPEGTYPEPAVGEKAPLSLDGSGNLICRSQVLTDEDSYYDDFVDETLDSGWTVTNLGGGSYDIVDSILELRSGTSDDQIHIIRDGDYLPISFSAVLRVGTLPTGCRMAIGLSNSNHPEATHLKRAALIFEGGTNTVQFQTTSSTTQIEESSYVFDRGSDILSWHTYRIEISAGSCHAYVDGEKFADHNNHIPGPYDVLGYGFSILNQTAVAIEPELFIDSINFRNHNVIEIAGNFTGDPIKVEIPDTAKVEISGGKHRRDWHAGLEEEYSPHARLHVLDDAVLATLNQMLTVLKKIEIHMAAMTDEEIDNGDVEYE